jgi:hypothetical protein
MGAKLGVAIMGLAVLAVGCATFGATPEQDGFGATMAQGGGASVRAGEARIVAVRVNPRVPIQAAADGDTVALRFGHARGASALVHLDGKTLAPVASEEAVATDRSTAPARGPVRVVLQGGRFVVCFRHSDGESGYRLMAQAWTADGSPLGPPVPISPPEADVYSAPEMVALDGHRAVVAFPAVADGQFELMAVPLELE